MLFTVRDSHGNHLFASRDVSECINVAIVHAREYGIAVVTDTRMSIVTRITIN